MHENFDICDVFTINSELFKSQSSKTWVNVMKLGKPGLIEKIMWTLRLHHDKEAAPRPPGYWC